MKHLPRSERFWVYVIVAFALFLVGAALVATVRNWRGDNPPPPAYENAPPVRLAPPDESGIADLDNVRRPPISDEDFLTLHKTTRVSIPKLLSPQWRAELEPMVSDPRVLKDVKQKLDELRQVAQGSKLSEAKDLYVTRPVGGKAETGGRLIAAAVSDEGQVGSEATFSFSFFWTNESGEWKIFGLVPNFSADAGSSSSSGGDGVPEDALQGSQGEPPAVPEDDSSSSGGDGVSEDMLDEFGG